MENSMYLVTNLPKTFIRKSSMKAYGCILKIMFLIARSFKLNSRYILHFSFFIILIHSFPIFPATKKKKGEQLAVHNTLTKNRDSLKEDMESTLSIAIQNSITKGGYISVMKDK